MFKSMLGVEIYHFPLKSNTNSLIIIKEQKLFYYMTNTNCVLIATQFLHQHSL